MWRAKAPAVKQYKALCADILREARVPLFMSPVWLHLQFYQFRNPELKVWRPRKKVWDFPFAISRDEDNARASVKALQDALKLAGVVPDDGRKHVRSGTCDLYNTAKEHQGRTCVVVTIEGEIAN